MADGTPGCEIDFAYGGREAEGLLWAEPCKDVTAEMMRREDLERLGSWERLEDRDRRFVEAMPAGTVLYVAGAFSAAVYPIDETGTSYEVTVAD